MIDYYLCDSDGAVINDNSNLDQMIQHYKGYIEYKDLPYIVTSFHDVGQSKSVCEEIRPFSHSIVFNNHIFASIENPNIYRFRFLGLFNKKTPYFEFLFDKEIHNLKTAFEESVFHYYFNDYERAFAGFCNILKICPSDLASIQYRKQCEKIIQD